MRPLAQDTVNKTKKAMGLFTRIRYRGAGWHPAADWQSALRELSTPQGRLSTACRISSCPTPRKTMDICFLSATEMARLIRNKALSAREVLDAHLRQIERLNPQVNAIVTLVEDQARKRAAQLDEEIVHGRLAGVLHGLPIAHKDITDTKGIRTTYGSPILRDYVPARNELIVDRIQAAGAITIGKTNTPEFGAGSQPSIRFLGPREILGT